MTSDDRYAVGDVRFVRHLVPRAPTLAEWLEQRRLFVGASQAAALFGDHPFLTLAQLAKEKRERQAQPDNDAMARGRRLENTVAEWWAEEHEVSVREAADLYIVNDCLVATLDRIVESDEAHGMANVALEVKTTARVVHDVERYWWWQAQAQLAATGFDRIEFAVLDATLRLKSYSVHPEPKAMADIVMAARTFLDAVNDPANTSFDDLVYRAPGAVELDAVPVREALRAWRMAEVARQQLDDDIGRLRGIVDRALGPCDRGTVNGAEVVRRMHRTVRNMIDTTRLRAEMPEVAAQYTKEPSTSHWLVLR